MFPTNPLLQASIAVILTVGLIGCGESGSSSADKEKTAPSSSDESPLIVGMELGYPPFEMIDPSGKPAGISVEMAQALADKLGRKLQIENIPFAGLIPALQSGRVDLVISSMTATPERARSVDFSDPYLKTGIALLVQANEPGESLTDLDQTGKQIAVKRGTTGHTYAEKNLKEAKAMIFDRTEAGVMEVVQGRADGFIYDQMSVDRYARMNPETTRPILEPIRVEEWAIALRKGSDTLREQVNAFLADFKANDGFEKLGNKYLKDSKESFAERGVPFVF